MSLTLSNERPARWLAPADPTKSHLLTKRPFTTVQRFTSALYASSDLLIIEIPRDQSAYLSADLTQSDPDQRRVYRCVDLLWYQWIFHTMRKAQAKAAAGEITELVWTTMRARFQPIRDWIHLRYPLDQLRAERNLFDARYRPPSPTKRFQAFPATIPR